MTNTPGPKVTLEGKATARAWAILAAMGFGALIAQMFSTVIGPALPTVRDDLSLSLSATTWLITAYSLAFGTALVAGGRLGDLVGEVRMIVIGFSLFAGGLVLSAIAMNGAMIISGRTIQGIGIGISAPATLSIVVNSFPVLQRGFAIGTWGFAHGAGLLVGPLIGGILTETIGWRWVFWIAVPLTVLVIFVTLVATRGYRSVLAQGTYDFWGLITGGIAITAITYGLQEAAGGLGKPTAWGSLVVGVLLGIVFAITEIKVRYPLVDFSLWKERLFSGGFFAQCAVGFVYIPMLTFIGSIFFVAVLGMSPVEAGWVIILTTGTCMVLEPPAGKLVDKIGPGIPITIGLLFQAVALFWFATFTPDATIGSMAVPLILMGAGVGICLPACNTSGMLAVDAPRAGMGSGLLQMTFNIPAALGVALITAIVGSLSVSKVVAQLPTEQAQQAGSEYVTQTNAGNADAANQAIANLPAGVAESVEAASRVAEASAIGVGMIVLGIVAVAGAIFAAVVIGRRRTPDNIEMTQAAEI